MVTGWTSGERPVYNCYTSGKYQGALSYNIDTQRWTFTARDKTMFHEFKMGVFGIKEL